MAKEGGLFYEGKEAGGILANSPLILIGCVVARMESSFSWALLLQGVRAPPSGVPAPFN